jgi:hypothetical protein
MPSDEQNPGHLLQQRTVQSVPGGAVWVSVESQGRAPELVEQHFFLTLFKDDGFIRQPAILQDANLVGARIVLVGEVDSVAEHWPACYQQGYQEDAHPDAINARDFESVAHPQVGQQEERQHDSQPSPGVKILSNSDDHPGQCPVKPFAAQVAAHQEEQAQADQQGIREIWFEPRREKCR